MRVYAHNKLFYSSNIELSVYLYTLCPISMSAVFKLKHNFFVASIKRYYYVGIKTNRRNAARRS